MSISTNKKSPNCKNKHQRKLIVLISTLKYINSKYQKYTQSNILYYFNKNLKRNGQNPIKLKTLQKYLYKLEKELKVTSNYHKHLGVNCGTEIYYKLNFSKKECYQKINQYFKEKKHSRFKKRVDNHYLGKFPLRGSVNLEECLSNKNNNIEEERNKQIEKFQIINYYNKCKFLSKKSLSLLNLNLNQDTMIEIFKTIKKIEISLIKNKNNDLNQPLFENKQNKLKEILINIQKELEKKGYNYEQLKKNFQKIYENYKLKPHFIIENQKYRDLHNIKRKLEKIIEIKKENSQKNYEHIKINIFNILIERLKNTTEIEVLKPILKDYLNVKKKLEYNKVFDKYYYELLEIIENEKTSLKLKEFSKKVV
ncbi:plasmid maintenance protein [Borreliella valaisiana]|uniref:plasmid maintenance protein n=1 Tax=Borreliella valaisiana TaxID=62088 RepID=UPI001AEEC6EC|nr:plasmid maintenance protein [Borreliella valaisiana]